MFLVSHIINKTERKLEGVKEFNGKTLDDIQKELDSWKLIEIQPMSVEDLDLYKVLQNETQLFYMVFYEDGDVLAGVACCAMGTGELCKMPSVVLVNGFLVHPSMRGRGIGREMFENLVSYLRFMQTQEESLKLFKVCILHSEPKNALFWKHLGCVAFDPGYLCPSDALRIQMLEKISNSRFLMFKL